MLQCGQRSKEWHQRFFFSTLDWLWKMVVSQLIMGAMTLVKGITAIGSLNMLGLVEEMQLFPSKMFSI